MQRRQQNWHSVNSRTTSYFQVVNKQTSANFLWRIQAKIWILILPSNKLVQSKDFRVHQRILQKKAAEKLWKMEAERIWSRSDWNATLSNLSEIQEQCCRIITRSSGKVKINLEVVGASKNLKVWGTEIMFFSCTKNSITYWRHFFLSTFFRTNFSLLH